MKTQTGDMFNAMSEAFGDIAVATYPDVATFTKSSNTKSNVGGNIPGAPVDRLPKNIPCRYKPASGYQKTLAEKPMSGTVYMFRFPSQFSGDFVNVDSRCDLELAARENGPAAKTFSIGWIGRARAYIQILASCEE